MSHKAERKSKTIKSFLSMHSPYNDGARYDISSGALIDPRLSPRQSGEKMKGGTNDIVRYRNSIHQPLQTFRRNGEGDEQTQYYAAIKPH